MRDYLAGLAGPQYVDAILWTLAALVLLVIVLLAIKGISAMNSGTFVAGGRARKTRLAVMDATAIDSQRRLVLVRRDDVEHLLLIGGPSDVVVEQDIRVIGQQRRPQASEPTRPPAAEEQAARAEPPAAPRPPPQLSPPHVTRPTPPQAERSGRSYASEPTRVADYPRPAAERTQPAPRPATPLRPPLAASAPQAVRAAPQPIPVKSAAPVVDDLDEALLSELDLAPEPVATAPSKNGAQSLDDEMAKLLGELSSPRK